MSEGFRYFSRCLVFSLLVFSCEKTGTAPMEQASVFSPSEGEIVYVGSDYPIRKGHKALAGMPVCLFCEIY